MIPDEFLEDLKATVEAKFHYQELAHREAERMIKASMNKQHVIDEVLRSDVYNNPIIDDVLGSFQNGPT